MNRVVRECQVLAGYALPGRQAPLASVFREFSARLSEPKSKFETVILRGLLLETCLLWGAVDHASYHRDVPSTENCDFDSARLTERVWRDRGQTSIAVFNRWSRSYIQSFQRFHPQYAAIELKRMLDYSFRTDVQVGRCAAELGVPMRRMQLQFRQLTGKSPQQYVAWRRTCAALDLLETTDEKVEWIARSVGWSSRKDLNKALARRGTSPRAIRVGAEETCQRRAKI